MYEASILDLFPTKIPGRGFVIGSLSTGLVCEGPADLVGIDGTSARVLVRAIMLGLHRIEPGGRVTGAEPGDVLAFAVDAAVEDLGWAVGGTLRGPTSG